MSKSFFEKINYSACNEDSESERAVLRLTYKDTVLCITGSGARPLDLLIDNPKSIISVDFNSAQNHLLSLKIAAYKTLNYSEFCSFIGLTDDKNRKLLFEKLKPILTAEQQAFWDHNYALIEHGVLYCGTWEKLLIHMKKWAFFRRKKIRLLFNARNVEEQKDIWNSTWKNGTWHFFLKLLSNRFLWTNIIREPGAKLIPKEFDVYHYMNGRLDYLAENHLLRTNHFANLMFYGSYQSDCLLPIHLREEHFQTIKERVDNIKIITLSIVEAVQNEELMSRISAFSLSDFSSYSREDEYNEIWNGIESHAKKDAKFCERFFLVKHNPEKMHARIQRNATMEKQLADSDITAMYTFCIGILK